MGLFGGFDKLSNNNDTILRCIHSEPGPIEKLLPGQTISQEGVIVFCRGDHNALVEQFEKLRSKHW